MTAGITARQIVMVPVQELIPYARNSRTHDEAQVAQIAASIREWGFTNPLLVDAAHGVIAGHGRLLAARQLGMAEVPTICCDGWTDAQKQAYVIADNKLALNAGWDVELLLVELEELECLGFDLDLTGFDPDEINALRPEVLNPGLTDEDSVPPLPESPATVLGDVWVMDGHRLMCGDSTSIDAVEGIMAGQSADMVFTDPPYGVDYQSNMRVKSAKFDVLANDNTILDIAPVLEIVSTGWMFVWTSWKVQNLWIDSLSGFGYPSNMVIWHKPGGGIGDLKKTFSTDYEVALVWHRGAELKGQRIGSVWTINKDGAATYLHPTQKPVALAEEAIDKTTDRNAVVLDLFGGSGSTLIACEKSGRRAMLMELDQKYCDVVVKRWQDFTGKQAILESTGQTFDEVKNARQETETDKAKDSLGKPRKPPAKQKRAVSC